ncbi:MAG TPA: CBS domain-containing protein [Candidatus Binatia bacterium]|jgi:acetoin utilization protein AcuB
MLVAMWMTDDPATVRPTATIADAAEQMSRRRFRHLLVTDRPGKEGELLGIVSLRDLARAFPPHINPLSAAGWTDGPRQPVGEVMTRQPCTVTPETTLEDAARLLLERKFGALPVVRGKRLAGILTEADVFKALLEIIGFIPGETASPGVRVTFDVLEGENAIALIVELARTHGMRVASVLTMEHRGRHLAVARVLGGMADGFVGGVWSSGHRVLSVVVDGEHRPPSDAT